MLTQQQLQSLRSSNSMGLTPSSPMTPEQAKASFHATPPSSKTPSYVDNVSNSQLSAGDKMTSGFNQINGGANQPEVRKTSNGANLSAGSGADVLGGAQQIGRGALNAVGGAIEGLTAPISGAMQSIGNIGVGKDQTLGGNIMKNGIQPIADKVSNSQTLQKLMQGNPHADEIAGNLLTIITSLMGGKEAPEIKSVVGGGIEKGLNATKEAVGGVNKTINSGVDTAMGNIKEGVNPTLKPHEAVGQIIQGKTEDIAPAHRTLESIDHTGIKTNADLASKLDSHIKDLTKQVDSEFEKDTSGGHSIKSFEQTIGEGKGAVKTNYVRDAIDELKNFYQKTNDAKGLANMNTLENHAKIKGMTYKEVNDLARLHGKELNGFNANGELASGLTKQAAENTRMGLKVTARKGLGSSGAEALDSKLHEAIDTKALVDKQVEAVNKANQNTTKQGAIPKAVGTAIKTLDTVTGSPLKAMGKIMGNAGASGKMTATEIESNLAKNLKSLKGSPTVGETVDPIITEAKKYKSAEEFVKAQGIPVYHGTSAKFNEFDNSKIGSSMGFDEPGFSFADTKDGAKIYSSDYPNKMKFKWNEADKLNAEKATNNVVEAYFDKKDALTLSDLSRLYDEGKIKTKPQIDDLFRPESVADNNRQAIKEAFKATGKNVFKATMEGKTNYIVGDSKVIKTKSQLIDIYNKAKEK